MAKDSKKGAQVQPPPYHRKQGEPYGQISSKRDDVLGKGPGRLNSVVKEEGQGDLKQ